MTITVMMATAMMATTSTTTAEHRIEAIVGSKVETTAGTDNKITVHIIIIEVLVILVELRRYSSDSNATQFLLSISGHFKTLHIK